MLHVLSFTSLCNAVLSRQLKIEALVDARYYFGCKRHHVVRDEDKLVPFEATWANEVLPCIYSRDLTNESGVVEITTVDEDHRQLLLDLLEVLRIADTECRVQYKTRMDEVVKQLPNDSSVFYDGSVMNVGVLKR